MEKPIDIIYVVASKLGSIGMGTTALNAIKSLNNSKEISYRIFCRGYDKSIKIDKKNIYSYGFLEILSLPLRFLEKKIGINIKPFKYINWIYGKLVEKELPKCKIYHTWMNVSKNAVIKAKKQGATLILEGANSHPKNFLKIMEEEYNLLGKKRFIPKKKEILKESRIIELFDYVMCPSKFVYNSFLKYGKKSKKQLILIPYGVDYKKFSGQRKKKGKKFRVIFIGSLQVRKGVHYLLKAWKELNLMNSELILVGRIWPDIEDIIKKYKKDKTIRFVGFNPNPSKYLKNANVFVSPSLEEGSALTCYEAMAAGLPVIATVNSGSIIRNKKEGFIIPIRDVEAIKEKIKYFHDNPKICEKMGRAARKRVKKFSWENYSKRLLKVYKKILREKNEKNKR